MPYRAPTICTFPGCNARAYANSRCASHPFVFRRKADDRPNSSRRGYNAEWRKIRADFLAQHPYCACGEKATNVDHVKPLVQGGTHDRDNLQALCARHHSMKTAMADGGFGNRRK